MNTGRSETVLARFSSAKAAKLTALIVGMVTMLWSIPFQMGESPITIAQHARWGFLWALSSIGAPYLIYGVIIMLLRIAFYNSSALYIKNGKLIYIFPFVLSVKIADIRSVSVFDGAGQSNLGAKIILLLRGGSVKGFKTSMFNESITEVDRRIRICMEDFASN